MTWAGWPIDLSIQVRPNPSARSGGTPLSREMPIDFNLGSGILELNNLNNTRCNNTREHITNCKPFYRRLRRGRFAEPRGCGRAGRNQDDKCAPGVHETHARPRALLQPRGKVREVDREDRHRRQHERLAARPRHERNATTACARSCNSAKMFNLQYAFMGRHSLSIQLWC